MSGKYPNGGYRNATARELSMPAEAAPPPVTAKPASGSGNTVHMQKSPRLSDMLGNGRGLAGPKHSGNVRVDLRGFADANADRLGYSPTDHLRRGNFGTGTHNVTIDLDPKSYRVNGRGYLMRQAIKAARSILKFNRRLPKNIWKELVAEILNQLLGFVEASMTSQSDSGYYTPADGWSLASYSSLGVPGQDGQSVPSHIVEGRSTAAIPAIGQTILARTIYHFDWSCGDPPQMRSLTGQHISSRQPDTRNAGWWIAHGTFANGRRAFAHVASYYRCFGTQPFSMKAGVLIRTGALNAPYSMAGPKSGGNFPPGDGGGSFPEPANDKKFSIPWFRGALSLAYAATELGDSIDCIYKALPKYRRYGRDYTDKMQRIYENFDEIQWDKALTCLAINQVTDPIIGRGFDFVDKAVGRATTSGFWAPGQITYGSGPGALELTF